MYDAGDGTSSLISIGQNNLEPADTMFKLMINRKRVRVNDIF
jgi:hypothetical protein